MSGPRPVADRLEAVRSLVIGVAAAPCLRGLQRRRRLIVNVLAILDALADRIREQLRKALHLLRGERGVRKARATHDCLETRHYFDCLCVVLYN